MAKTLDLLRGTLEPLILKTLTRGLRQETKWHPNRVGEPRAAQRLLVALAPTLP